MPRSRFYFATRARFWRGEEPRLDPTMKRFATWGMIAMAGGLLAAAVATVVPEIARPPAEQVRSDASARVAEAPAIPDAKPPALSLAPSETDGAAAATPSDARPAVTGSIPVPLGPDRREAARLALGQLAQLASGEATVAGTSLRIRGDALYAQAAEDIRHKTGRNAPAGWAASAEIRTRSVDETDAE